MPQRLTPIAAAALALLFLSTGQAQTVPDAGQLLRESNQPLAPVPVPELPARPAPAAPADDGPRVVVKRFVFEGVTRFDDATLQGALADLKDKELGFPGLQAAGDRISQLYRKAGLAAAVSLPPQELNTGELRIVVNEARFGALKAEPAEGARRLPLGLLGGMVNRGQQPGSLLDVARLESGTLVANDVPGVRATTLLQPGTQPGLSDVLVRLE